jgi:hypothetical protein
MNIPYMNQSAFVILSKKLALFKDYGKEEVPFTLHVQ